MPTASRANSGPPPASRRLHSWKEIADYLRRGITTVQRWEREEGLPVRRHLHAASGSVFADTADIDGGLNRRSTRFWGNFPEAAAPSSRFAVIFNGGLRSIADAHLSDIGDSARLFALATLAMADSQIGVYETKYLYSVWRPYTAIREGDADGNPATGDDTTWTPFVNTPPYPDHSAGANSMSGAFTGILRSFFGTDDMDFALNSPAANLLSNPRSYQRFSPIADEIVDVRVFQGIHFRFADEQGRQQGERIAHWTFQRFLRPVTGR